MKKTSTLYTPEGDSVSVNTGRRRLGPSPVTIAKICQLARCAFPAGKTLPPLILN